MEQVAWWWSGSYGRLSRRDVLLRRGAVWEVEAREGGAEGQSKIFRFDSEDEATRFAERCGTGPGRWRELAVSAAAVRAEAPREGNPPAGSLRTLDLSPAL